MQNTLMGSPSSLCEQAPMHSRSAVCRPCVPLCCNGIVLGVSSAWAAAACSGGVHDA